MAFAADCSATMRKAKQDNHAKSGFHFQQNCIKSGLLNNGTSTANVIAECRASNDATHVISSGVVGFFFLGFQAEIHAGGMLS